jgi:hypothetical protein
MDGTSAQAMFYTATDPPAARILGIDNPKKWVSPSPSIIVVPTFHSMMRQDTRTSHHLQKKRRIAPTVTLSSQKKQSSAHLGNSSHRRMIGMPS